MPNKPSILLPALYGGIIIGVISAVPGLSLLNCFCCAGIMLGGFFAVFFYKKDLTANMPPLSSNDGLRLGALAGVFGAVVSLILSRLVLTMFGGGDVETIKSLLDSFGVSKQLPEGALDELETGMRGPLGFFQVVISFIINPLFGLIGGLIGYAVFKPKILPAPPPPPVQQG
jgi:hypothetical protein